jgi:hypothetical protein
MPIDLGSFGESIQRGLGEIPPVAIALALLAGPTLLLIGYRMIWVARRMQTSRLIDAEPYWVCHDCRSVNELSHRNCYRCGLARDATAELEVIVEQPALPKPIFDVPAGSPFAAIAANPMQLPDRGPGVPVMGGSSTASDAVAVGPGAAHPVAVPVVAEDGEALFLAEMPAETALAATGADLPGSPEPTGDATLEPASERQA